MNLPSDKSAEKKIKIFASCFMGLSHLLFLKDYVKGIFFVLCEIVFIGFIPSIIRKLIDLVTLGSPLKMRDNSIFMLIDGILILAVIAVFVAVYYMSVKSAENGYKEYCRTGCFKN